MADTSRTVKVRFDGSAAALGVASKAAEKHLESFRKQTEAVDKSLTRIFTTGTKATLALGSVGGAVPILAGVAASAVTAAGALLVLPGAALAGAAAVTVLKLATAGFADAVSAKDPAAFAKATKDMAPAAIEAATALRGLRPEFVALRQEVQQRFFAGFAADARALGGTYLPVLRPQLAGIAAGFNAMGREAVRALMAPPSVTAVNSVLGDTRGIVGDLRPALGNVLAGVLAIGGQGTAQFRGFGAAVTDVTTRFRDWATQAAESGRITELIREGKDELRAWGDVAGNVGGILATIFAGITDDQGNFADGLVETTQALEDFLNTAEGQGALQALGETLRVTADVARTVLLAALRELGPVIIESAPAAQEFARVLGVILVDAIQTVGPMLQDFARFLSENKAVIGDVLPILAGLVLGFKALSVIQSVAGWVKGATTVLGGLGAAAGPLGVAITIASAAVFLFAQRQNDAAAAAAAHDGAISTLKSTLDEYTGAVTDATVAETSRDIAERKLSDGTTTFAKALRDVGITFVDYTNAASGNADALAEVNSQLFVAAQRTPGLQELYAKWKPRLDEAGISFDTLTAAAIGNGGAFDELTSRLGVSGAGFDAWRQDLSAAVGPVGELGSALGEYNAVLTEAQEQTRQAAEVSKNFHTILETVKAGLVGLKDGAAPLPPMVAAFTDLGRSAEVAAEAAAKSAAEFGGVSAGAEAARRSMEDSRSSFIASATAAGLTAEEANKLADQIGLIPTVAETRFQTNATGVTADLLELGAQVAAVPDAKQITVNSTSPEVIRQLRELGIEVRDLPNGQVEIDLKDEAGRARFEAFIATINTASAAPTLDLNTATATEKANGVKAYIDGLIGIATADANAAPGTEKADGLKAHIDGIVGILTADANPAPGTEKANQLQAHINGLLGIMTADANNAPGTAKGDALRSYINGLLGIMTATANTQPGTAQSNALKAYVDRLRAAITADANTGPGQSALDDFIRRNNGRRITIFAGIQTSANVGGAGGGLVGYAGGGVLGMARGGVISGYAPGRDTVPALLSRGEAVLVPELVRAIGAKHILAANRAASGRPPTFWSGGGMARFAAGGIAAARSYLMAGLERNAPRTGSAPVMAQMGDIAVRVYLGDQELRGLVRTEIDTSNRATARGVRVGAGVTY